MAPRTTDADGPAYPIGSVDRALTVLLAFQTTESLTVGEVGELLGVARSTAYRLLSLLEHRDFVRQDPATKAFHGGPALVRVGLTAVHRSDVRVHLRPLLQRIVDEVDETTHLVVLQQGEAFFLDCVEGTKMVRSTSRVGDSLPAYVGAGGKVLLSQLPEDKVDGEILVTGVKAVTPRANTSIEAVRRDLATVRERGWSLNDGESEAGLRAVSVFVPGAPEYGSVDAAVSVSGPAERLPDDQLEDIIEVMKRCVVEYHAELDSAN
jgi:DNA-binding IclR family transcriptional regulator